MRCDDATGAAVEALHSVGEEQPSTH